MTVQQLEGSFYEDTHADRRKFPPARILSLVNEGQLDFCDKTLCLKGDPISRLTMVDKQKYSFSGDRGYLDTASGYKWTDSVAVPGEYHVELTAGGDPSIDEPDNVHMDGVKLTEGTLGSLADHEWAYGDNDTLGYDTVYIADASGDPDALGSVILLEPGGFGSTTLLRPIYVRHDSYDITDDELSIMDIGIDESTWSDQHYSIYNDSIYLDPLPAAQKTLQIWPAIKPTVMTVNTETPDIDTAYHPHLLDYVLWKYYDGAGKDTVKAKDYERQYKQAVDEAFGQVKMRSRTGSRSVRRVSP